MAKIFLSYARVDLPRLEGLLAKLKRAGHEVWVDVEGETGGDLWRTRIVQEIEACNALLLVMSASAITSDNVRRELDVAVDARKRLIPVELDHIETPTHMKYQLSGIERVDLTGDNERGVEKILLALSAVDARHSAPPMLAEPVKPTPRNGWWAVAVVAFVIGGFTYFQEFVGCPESAKPIRLALLGAYAQVEADYLADGNLLAYQAKLANLQAKAAQLSSSCFKDTALAPTEQVTRMKPSDPACPQLWSAYERCIEQRKKDSVLGKVSPACPPMPSCRRG